MNKKICYTALLSNAFSLFTEPLYFTRLALRGHQLDLVLLPMMYLLLLLVLLIFLLSFLCCHLQSLSLPLTYPPCNLFHPIRWTATIGDVAQTDLLVPYNKWSVQVCNSDLVYNFQR